ncbi:Rpn family recombination-promoting nuclease/putative transposase [Thiotrichales bacterium 19X7-9]|nr:Rpn family recombination-promoting nuclease/putative transposase [Thiotrichales bacterium 19X7-9]
MAKKKKKDSITMPHDSFFKANLSNKKKAEISLRTHLSKSLIKHVDFSTLEPMPTEFIKHTLGKLASDMLYKVKIKGKDAYFYYLFEAQSSPDYLMPFRILNYEIQIMQSHLDAGNDKLPIIVSLVFYHGDSSPYPYSTSIYDLFEDIELAKKYAFNNFELVDLTVMTKEQMAQLNPELLFEFLLKYNKDNLIKRLTEWLINNPDQSLYFLTSSKKLLNQVLSYIEEQDKLNKESVPKLIDVINKNTDGEFMNYLEKREAKAKNQGLEEGAIQKAQETARNMLLKNYNPKEIADLTSLELETVLDLKKDIENRKKK